METQKEIGGIITLLRERRRLTQSEFAKRLKTSQSAVARMEKGEQNFSTEMLTKISKVLGSDIVTVGKGTVNLEIEGGHKLHGTVRTNTSKNAAVACLAGSLLNESSTELKSVPRIEEVFRVIEVLESLGARVVWNGSDVTITPPKKVLFSKIDKEAAIKTRSILLLIGPLLHTSKIFSLPQAGGCKMGSRTVRPHFFALEKLGVDIVTKTDHYRISRKKPVKASREIVLYESGDTVTENALMAAARIPGTTTIKLASANYQVQDLCYFLRSMGVRIEGIGSSTLTVYGLSRINTPVTYTLSPDPIESMFFLAAAIVTKSSITITACPIDFLELELLKLEKMGFKYKLSARYKGANGEVNLVDIKTYPSKLKALEEKVYARPFPGLNIDNLPFFATIATQAEGQTLIHDWVFEGRAIYYTELAKLRADIILADPHRVYINGRTELRAAEVICPPALRPAAIILVAMLAARGTSVLRNIYTINRGYEDLANRLNKLGARIKTLREI